MAKLDNSGIRTAKKTVARWFHGSETRRFLPLSGAGLAVSRAEERAILAAAERYIAARFDRLNGQLALALMLTVGVPTLHAFHGDRLPAALSPPSGAVALASFTLGGAAMLWAAWRYERSVLDLRDGVALALRERDAGSALPPIVPEERDRTIRHMAAIAFVLAGLLLLWPLAGAVPEWSGPGAARWLTTAGGFVAGLLLWIFGYAAVWALWLRGRSAPPEDRAR